MGHYFFFRFAGGEAHEFRLKAERNVPGGAVAVLGEVQVGLSGQLLPLVLVVGVVVGAVKQADHVRVLLDRAGFPQIGHAGNPGFFPGARLRSAVQLGQHDDGNLEFLGQGFQARGYFRDFAFPAVGRLFGVGTHQLEIVHADDGQLKFFLWEFSACWNLLLTSSVRAPNSTTSSKLSYHDFNPLRTCQNG